MRLRVIRLPDWNAHTRQHCSGLSACQCSLPILSAREPIFRDPVAGLFLRAAALPIWAASSRFLAIIVPTNRIAINTRPHALPSRFEPPQRAGSRPRHTLVSLHSWQPSDRACRSPPSGNQPSSQLPAAGRRSSRPSRHAFIALGPLQVQRATASIGATPPHHPITAARFDTAPSPDARLIPPQSGGEERQLPSVVIPPDAHGCAPIREGQDKRCSVPRRPAC